MCYTRSMQLAKRRGCASIAFVLMAAGNNGFPKPLALQIAMNAISSFLMQNEMQVYLVVFSRDAFRLSETVFQGVSSYIDEHYVLEQNFKQYGVSDKCMLREQKQQMLLREQLRRQDVLSQTPPQDWEDFSAPQSAPETNADAPNAPRPNFPSYVKALPKAEPAKRSSFFPLFKPKQSLAELLAETDAGFSETLLKLIDRTGKKDSEIYTKANISRQHFSKIRNNPDYQPKKHTALALAIALELDLEQTRDLIGRAGYALTNSSKADLIIMYFIQQKHYNLYDINAALFEFDQSLLGG